MPDTDKILIVDDEEQLRKLLTRIVGLEGFDVTSARNLKDARTILETQPVALILCDVRLPDGNGVDFVRVVKQDFPATEIILLTAFGNIADGVQAIKNGAFDYITKGNDNDRIIPLVHQAMDKISATKAGAVRIAKNTPTDFGTVIGESEQIHKAIDLAKRIAPTDSTVLLLGETGTGKEVFANALHGNSKRNTHAFVAINCSAFSRELLEGELFGHKAGAYTGAAKDKKGLVEVADGGTLFLDEIGELDIDLQAKLLRVLENGEFIKLGDVRVSKTNIRIIAATNRDLEKEVEQGKFREDLYYRLNIFSIELPSLRQRKGDIPALASFFLTRFAAKQGRDVRIGKEAMELLVGYAWKGNVRELKNVLERALILVDGSEIQPAHLPYAIQQQGSQPDNAISLASVEKQHIEKILRFTGGNKAQAARLLQIGLATLYRKLDEYGLSKNLPK
ncbi:MAG: sigma-54-dependent Fis family transcriptional regulator [Chitinophagaceae bacterium]|nr:MAG: sigma-54-dependent Fis family transcriptional regulator [Chitinophagaceae bacterium]